MSGRSRIAALGVAVALTAAPLRQEVREIVLKPADATLAEPFTSILSIRELADGRVLISDNSAETRLVSADLRTQRVRLVGQIGGGPGEYRRAGGLFALPHDSTFFIDAPDRERRWLLLHADSIVVTLPPDFPAFRITGSLLHGVDWGGRLLGVRQAGGERLSQDVTRDRWIAVLGHRGSAHADTVSRLRGAEFRITQHGTRERPTWMLRQRGGSAAEQALLVPDGWIGIVHVDPYRVEWRRPDGSLIRGPNQTWEAPRADAKERAAALERLRRRYGPDYKDETPWADRLAPVRSNALLGTPEGNLLVLRSQWSQASDTRYDVFDREGVIGRLAMPDSERVAGFGSRTIYISSWDQDGFYKLRRHPWP